MSYCHGQSNASPVVTIVWIGSSEPSEIDRTGRKHCSLIFKFASTLVNLISIEAKPKQFRNQSQTAFQFYRSTVFTQVWIVYIPEKGIYQTECIELMAWSLVSHFSCLEVLSRYNQVYQLTDQIFQGLIRSGGHCVHN